MNSKFSLSSIKPQVFMAALQRHHVVLIGVALIGLIGYTAYTINSALNPNPAPADTATSIRFDPQAIQVVKSLEVVPVATPVPGNGKIDPFVR